MARFTKALRQQIVGDFAKRHGGTFDAALFEQEVRRKGADHPAFDWFEWDEGKAALEHRLDQARAFARGLVIKFEVQEVHRGKMRIAEHTVPLVLSPAASRKDGGGYIVTDPTAPEHMEELRREAARSLRWFLNRYNAVLGSMGISLTPFEKAQAMLEDETETREAA